MNAEVDKKQLIVESAYEVFKRFGYEKTSMNDIAKEAKMGKGSIYYYFESKEDIFISCLTFEVQQGFLLIENELINIEDPVERIKRALLKPLEMVSSSPLLMQIWNNKSYFMKKLEDFKDEKLCLLRNIIKDCLLYAKDKNVLVDDFYVEEFSNIILRWFYLGSEDVSFELTSDLMDTFIADFKLMSKYILYGILKRS